MAESDAESTPLKETATSEKASRKSSSAERTNCILENQKPILFALGAIFVAGAIGGIIAGIVLAVSGGAEEIQISLPGGTNITAYVGEWTAWEESACSVSCGAGQNTRQRSCVHSDASLSNIVCEANGTYEEFQFDVLECEEEECRSGRVLVLDTIEQIRQNLAKANLELDDKDFLKRYAESVTNFGAQINADGYTGGAGIWRLEEDDREQIAQLASSSRKMRRNAAEISKNYIVNLKSMCDVEITQEQLTPDKFPNYLDDNPCDSACAVMTVMAIQGKYPLPRDPQEQEKIIKGLSEQQLISMGDILAQEAETLQQKCATKDFDFEFLIDSSGSVTAQGWKDAVESIANAWIPALQPVFGNFGIHVAARWYSSSVGTRFVDFQHGGFQPVAGASYPSYVANLIRREPYHDGGTKTGAAIDAVRTQDLPRGRRLGKAQTIVVVFTDGQSGDDAPAAAKRLQSHATVYSVGIGTNVNTKELDGIASSGKHSSVISFDQLENLINEILGQEAACKDYDCERIFRLARSSELQTKGCSFITGEEHGCGFTCNADMQPPKHNPQGNDCIQCSQKIAESHLAAISSMKNAIQSAANAKGVEPALVAAMISKATNAGADLLQDGYAPCPPLLDNSEGCFGVMRVPVFHIKNFANVKQKGPKSQEAIEAGIELIAKTSKCVCESTKLSQRQTKEDIARINERVIAGYQVGCANVPPTGIGNDIKDKFNYDFSNDVIARAQFFEINLFPN